MANWVKLLLGVLVSAGIFVGVWAWVYDTHPLRDDSIYAQRQRCEVERPDPNEVVARTRADLGQ